MTPQHKACSERGSWHPPPSWGPGAPPSCPGGGWAELLGPCLLDRDGDWLDPPASFTLCILAVAPRAQLLVGSTPSFPFLLIPSLSSERTLISQADLSV